MCNGRVFTIACANGHSDIVKYLLYKLKFKLNINNFKGFRIAYRNGQLHVVKLIFEYCRLTCTNIDIHRNNECAFRWACERGHLEIIKVLLEYDRINIHALNDKAKFLIEYSYKHFDIILLTNKMFYFINDRSNIDIFKYFLEYKIKTNNKIKIHKTNIKTYKEFIYFYDLSKHNNDIIIGIQFNTHCIIKLTNIYNKLYIHNNNFCKDRNCSCIYDCTDKNITYNFILYYPHVYNHIYNSL